MGRCLRQAWPWACWLREGSSGFERGPSEVGFIVSHKFAEANLPPAKDLNRGPCKSLILAPDMEVAECSRRRPLSAQEGRPYI